jgi:hypothetical protein
MIDQDCKDLDNVLQDLSTTLKATGERKESTFIRSIDKM